MARYCSNCGHELGEGDRFCSECGTPTQEGARHASDPNHQRPQESGVWTGVKLGFGMFVVLPIIIIVLVIVLWLLLSTS
jgi:uncharacterized membrane protein YvbJ